MDKNLYKPRIIDEQIKKYLKIFGAICIEGPKWCGKTWTSNFHSKSIIMLGDPAGNFQNKKLAETSPEIVLEGESPRLIDEWQEVPRLWDAVRNKVDSGAEKGRYILTGSATPNRKGILHSGAGRIGKLRMRPMSLYESGDSSGDVSLKELSEGKFVSKMTGDVNLKKIIEFIIRGGWPGNLNTPLEIASVLPTEYLKAIIDNDASQIDGTNRNVRKMNLLLRSLARNESTTASNKTLKNDIKEIDNEDIDIDTVSSYLDVFDRLFLLDNQLPFSSNIRSSVAIKQSEKRHFSDPSLASALLKATPEKLLNDLNTLGFLFEALCERDLKIYAESMNANVYHYQDYKNREIDAVIELEDGTWIAIEIKLGANQIDEAAAKLLNINLEIENENGKTPKMLCIICGLSNAAYQREDGVYVIPITALKN
ncbi:MAG: DUF4143 domain-containing protein [Bacilli bacterium]|nr:DUF4143 domain-containing protein [Bacilli bacterium]